MKKIGIFSGSFNPIHVGHLALANYLCEFEELDEVWFLITPHNPLKTRQELMNDTVRYEMVQTAIAGYSKFKVSDFEFRLPLPSYTVHTLQALKAAYPGHAFSFIMGADNWNTIFEWKEYQTLIQKYPILIYPRSGYTIEIPACHPHIRAVTAPLIEISSTFLRDAIRSGKDVRFFLPAGLYNRCRNALNFLE